MDNQSTTSIMKANKEEATTSVSQPSQTVEPRDGGFLPRRPLKRNEAIICVLAILAWVVLAAAGVAVSTKPFIDLVNSPIASVGALSFVEAMFIIIMCYTF